MNRPMLAWIGGGGICGNGRKRGVKRRRENRTPLPSLKLSHRQQHIFRHPSFVPSALLHHQKMPFLWVPPLPFLLSICHVTLASISSLPTQKVAPLPSSNAAVNANELVMNPEKLDLLLHNAAIFALLKAKARSLTSAADFPAADALLYARCAADAKTAVQMARCIVPLLKARDEARRRRRMDDENGANDGGGGVEEKMPGGAEMDWASRLGRWLLEGLAKLGFGGEDGKKKMKEEENGGPLMKMKKKMMMKKKKERNWPGRKKMKVKEMDEGRKKMAGKEMKLKEERMNEGRKEMKEIDEGRKKMAGKEMNEGRKKMAGKRREYSTEETVEMVPIRGGVQKQLDIRKLPKKRGGRMKRETTPMAKLDPVKFFQRMFEPNPRQAKRAEMARAKRQGKAMAGETMDLFSGKNVPWYMEPVGQLLRMAKGMMSGKGMGGIGKKMREKKKERMKRMEAEEGAEKRMRRKRDENEEEEGDEKMVEVEVEGEKEEYEERNMMDDEEKKEAKRKKRRKRDRNGMRAEELEDKQKKMEEAETEEKMRKKQDGKAEEARRKAEEGSEEGIRKRRATTTKQLDSNIAKLRRIQHFYTLYEHCERHLTEMGEANSRYLGQLMPASMGPPLLFRMSRSRMDGLADELQRALSNYSFHSLPILSPRLLSLFPEAASQSKEPSGVLSPTMFSFHQQGLFSLPTLFGLVASSEGEMLQLLDLFMDLSGAARVLDKILAEIEPRMEAIERDLYPTVLKLEQIERRWEAVRATLSERQKTELERTGYTLLDTAQFGRLYGRKRAKQWTLADEELLEEDIRRMAQIEDGEGSTRKMRPKRATPGRDDNSTTAPDMSPSLPSLRPFLYTNKLRQNAAVAVNGVVLSPRAFATTLTSPNFMWINVLSPVAFAPNILSPRAAALTVLSPTAFTANVLTPNTIWTEVLSPKFFHTNVLSPRALAALILSPRTMLGEVLSPKMVEFRVLNPATFFAGVLTPNLLMPRVLSPNNFGVTVLSPNILSPTILSKGNFTVQVLSPSIMSDDVTAEQFWRGEWQKKNATTTTMGSG